VNGYSTPSGKDSSTPSLHPLQHSATPKMTASTTATYLSLREIPSGTKGPACIEDQEPVHLEDWVMRKTAKLAQLALLAWPLSVAQPAVTVKSEEREPMARRLMA
jgi:hypothetical protein